MTGEDYFKKLLKKAKKEGKSVPAEEVLEKFSEAVKERQHMTRVALCNLLLKLEISDLAQLTKNDFVKKGVIENIKVTIDACKFLEDTYETLYLLTTHPERYNTWKINAEEGPVYLADLKDEYKKNDNSFLYI